MVYSIEKKIDTNLKKQIEKSYKFWIKYFILVWDLLLSLFKLSSKL
jgi:hypothetical protein